jgi:hypothetical protein
MLTCYLKFLNDVSSFIPLDIITLNPDHEMLKR